MNASPGIDSLSSFKPASTRTSPDFTFEEHLLANGKTVAGIDEAGRGPLAGPVVAAAVMLNPDNIPAGLNDSKKLTAIAREKLFREIAGSAKFAWCAVGATKIDQINILQATMCAMTGAANAMPHATHAFLIDGRDVPSALQGRGISIIKGDAKSLSIAAASIVAKVMRDRMMWRADTVFPDYGFVKNAGYGTRKHLDALASKGPCPLHRRSFAPVRAALVNQGPKTVVSSAWL